VNPESEYRASQQSLSSAWPKWARLAAWYLPGGPVGPASRWAAASNVELGQTTFPVNRGRVKKDGGEGNEGQSHKEEEREGGSGTERGLRGP